MTDQPGLNWLRIDTLRVFGDKGEMAMWVQVDERSKVLALLRQAEYVADPVRAVHIEQLTARWQCFV